MTALHRWPHDGSLDAWLAHCARCWEPLRMRSKAREEAEHQRRINEGFGLPPEGEKR